MFALCDDKDWKSDTIGVELTVAESVISKILRETAANNYNLIALSNTTVKRLIEYMADTVKNQFVKTNADG
jgi:hypothetical protein